jgi:hypothetical protein
LLSEKNKNKAGEWSDRGKKHTVLFARGHVAPDKRIFTRTPPSAAPPCSARLEKAVYVHISLN